MAGSSSAPKNGGTETEIGRVAAEAPIDHSLICQLVNANVSAFCFGCYNSFRSWSFSIAYAYGIIMLPWLFSPMSYYLIILQFGIYVGMNVCAFAALSTQCIDYGLWRRALTDCLLFSYSLFFSLSLSTSFSFRQNWLLNDLCTWSYLNYRFWFRYWQFSLAYCLHLGLNK